MNILLGITGSIASILHEKIYKELSQLGTVKVVTTKNALEITNISSYTDDDEYKYLRKELQEEKLGGLKNSDVLHVDLRDWADILIIAPLTANTMAKISYGFADNLLTNIFRCWDFSKPVIIAPTMNTKMWLNQITNTQLDILTKLGVNIIPPQEKMLKCGEYGIGAMCDISKIKEKILKIIV